MVDYDLVNTPIVDVVNRIILYAAQNKASDIHLDPREDSLMVRMRIDGRLKDHANIPKMYEKNLATRVKLISKMNITETRVPQDGAIKGLIDGKELDMRVSALPTNEGEKIVIRLLDYSNSLNGMSSLGFLPANLKKVERMMDIPNGIILVTGATGSGKSTTTYSMLNALNTEDRNIITVEDPVEMNIEGINQVHVNAEIGLTFAAALRSILRQDPNVILIGEIRDSETAQIAVRAAITGHLVLSTIHTNNALATIERLLDMQVERYLLSTALNGIISQKLARTLCENCKQKRPSTSYEKHIFKKVLGKDVQEVYDAVGCDKCNRGFKGRIALHEVLYISEHLREMISQEGIDKDRLREEVYNGDTTTLLQDALEKVLMGVTTFKEVYRVVDIDVDLESSIRNAIVEEEVEKAKKEKLDIINAFEKDEKQDPKKLLPKSVQKEIYDIVISNLQNPETSKKYSNKPVRTRLNEIDIIDVFGANPPLSNIKATSTNNTNQGDLINAFDSVKDTNASINTNNNIVTDSVPTTKQDLTHPEVPPTPQPIDINTNQ